jgi:hypothetical protein
LLAALENSADLVLHSINVLVLGDADGFNRMMGAKVPLA